MRMYKKDNTETSEDGNVTIKVEKNSAVEDQDENNPESQIKMMISNNKTKKKSIVVIKLYNTNQSIVLQGAGGWAVLPPPLYSPTALRETGEKTYAKTW